MHRPLCAVLAAGLLAGCVGSRQSLDACYASARARDFGQAVASLDRSSLARSERSRLLYMMEKGLLLRLQGERRESNRLLEQADRLTDELYTLSFSAESLSYISNDGVIPYSGEDYESVYLNYYQALNYLDLGETGEALVECRRLDEKLTDFAARHEGRARFGESAFLRLLTGLVYEASGDPNNAFIAYRKSLDAYRQGRERYGFDVPTLLWGRLLLAARRSGLAEEYEHYREEAHQAGIEPQETESAVVVIAEQGFAPVKVESFVLVPTQEGLPVKVSVPAFAAAPCPPVVVEAAVDGGERVASERVEDLDAVARRSLADRMGLVLAKAAARAAAKQVLARQAEKEYGPLAGLAVQAVALLSERADLRSWRSLPAQILLALVPAEPGWHTVSVRAGDGETFHAVQVEAGSLDFVTLRIP